MPAFSSPENDNEDLFEPAHKRRVRRVLPERMCAEFNAVDGHIE